MSGLLQEMTPLHYVAVKGHMLVVQLLLRHAAEASLEDEDVRLVSCVWLFDLLHTHTHTVLYASVSCLCMSAESDAIQSCQ